MSRSDHKSWFLVEGLRRRKGKVVDFSKHIKARSAADAKRRVAGWNKRVYKMDNSFKP
jgi:hypothetical protein